MRRHQLREIISEGESSTVEFKRKCASPQKIARELIAFANSSGGVLLVGVDDDGSIVGVKSEKEEIEIINHACEFFSDPPIEPEISIIQISYEDVVVVEVSESDQKPHRMVENDNGKAKEQTVYIRKGASTVAASKEVAKVLAGQNSNSPPITLSIGRHEKKAFEYLNDNDRITVREFAHFSNISERRAARLLVRLVRAGVLHIHTNESLDYYTLAS